VVQEYERAVIFRLGRLLAGGSRGPGKDSENLIYVFPEMKLRGIFPNSYIHVSVSDLYIPSLFGCRKIDRSWEYITYLQIHECGKWETVH